MQGHGGIRLETRPDRVEMFSRGERAAVYLPNGEPPGLFPLLSVEGRPVTQPAFDDGVSVWLGHANLDGFSFGHRGPNVPDACSGQYRTDDLIARRGSQSIGLEHTCGWFATNGERLMTDVRTLRFQQGPAQGSILDFRIALHAPEDRASTLHRSDEGLFRIALASAFLAASGQIRNSAGDFGSDIHNRSAEWCTCVGVVRAETVGLVVLAHPANPSNPPVWNLDPLGTLQINPSYWHDLVIQPGGSITYRFRLLTHAGFVEAGWATARHREYSTQNY